MGDSPIKNAESQQPEIGRRSFRCAVNVVKHCHRIDQQPGVGRGVMSQMARSGTSVGSNVKEARAAESRADFVSKMSIALKEARETHYRLRVMAASDIQPLALPVEQVQGSDEIRRVLGTIGTSTKRTRQLPPFFISHWPTFNSSAPCSKSET
jgi:four helix bundle protein